MSHLFISYVAEDSRVALAVAAAMGERGYATWTLIKYGELIDSPETGAPPLTPVLAPLGLLLVITALLAIAKKRPAATPLSGGLVLVGIASLYSTRSWLQGFYPPTYLWIMALLGSAAACLLLWRSAKA